MNLLVLSFDQSMEDGPFQSSTPPGFNFNKYFAGIADNVMTSLLQMLKSSSGTGGVQEDALMAVGTLTEVVGPRFIGYLDAFKEYLLAGLQNKAEYQVSIALITSIAFLFFF